MNMCIICNQQVQGRKRIDAVVCTGKCSKELATRRTRAWRAGEPFLKRAPGQTRKSVNRRAKLRLHGLDRATIDFLMASPSGICDACGELAVLAVDHDHEHCPGKYGCPICIRGFLCPPCNFAAGAAKDDPVRLERLAIYLRETAA